MTRGGGADGPAPTVYGRDSAGAIITPATPMVHALRLSTFLTFVGLGLILPFVQDAHRRRTCINAFLGYVLALNAFVAVAQTDAWPFSPYRMMAVDSRGRGAERSMIAFRGFDDQGREWDVEPLAWSPLFPQAIMGWFEVGFPRATPEGRQEVVGFLWERAEEARRARRTQAWFGNERLLGPLAAPDTNLSRPAREISGEPLVGLRVYRVFWVSEELLRDPSSVRRTLVFEYRHR